MKTLLTHPLWDVLGLALAVIVLLKLMHPGIPKPWAR